METRTKPAITVSCGTGFDHQRENAELRLESQGYLIDPRAPVVLLLDEGPGHALLALEAGAFPNRAVIVVTWNRCPEYLEDVW